MKWVVWIALAVVALAAVWYFVRGRSPGDDVDARMKKVRAAKKRKARARLVTDLEQRKN